MSAAPLRAVDESYTASRTQPLLLRRYDEVVLLTILVGLVFLIPARLVVGPLGAAGRPSVLFCTGLGLLWIFALLQRPGVDRHRQPVRWIACCYLLSQLIGYAVGWDRGLTDAESSSADRWLLVTLAMVGLAVFVADGVPSRSRLDDLLRRCTWGGAAMASVGALQFLAGFDLTQYLRIPGLRPNSDLIGMGQRGEGFARIAGTASHYIEFGVLLGMILPLALHYAFFARSRAQRLRRWLVVAGIASAIPFSVSRSGVLAAMIAMVLIAVVWPWRLRYGALVIGAVALVAYRLVQPGLLGTIRSLFTNVDNDPSIEGRTDDYAAVGAFIAERPWFGRGAGTFIPEEYILLDNQFLGTFVASGIVGFVALALVFLGGYWTARSIRLRGADQETRHLGQVLAASMSVGIVCSATFDSLSFTGFTCLTFLFLGAIGALWRLDDGVARRPLQAADPLDRYVASPWMAERKAGST